MKSSIAVVPLHEGYDLTLFVKSFSKLLKHSQTCRVLSSQTISPENNEIAQAESDSVFERSLTQVIQQFKKAKDVIIYITDNDLSNWSKRSLNAVDNIFIIGQSRNDAKLTPIAQKVILQKNNDKTSLIVEFPNKTIESEEASHWLVPKNINHFHPISKNNLSDLEQLIKVFLNQSRQTNLIKKEIA